ncbi:hypothetical protein SDC9_156675 [bioreactor metagenome]|uniref:Uncharacterized protein n=1 Tax=bioreactor metagenome TaxID=1076179 RepID=A0A645F4W3_9ZZZZ
MRQPFEINLLIVIFRRNGNGLKPQPAPVAGFERALGDQLRRIPHRIAVIVRARQQKRHRRRPPGRGFHPHKGTAAAPPVDQRFLLQQFKRLAQRFARHAEFGGKLTLGLSGDRYSGD